MKNGELINGLDGISITSSKTITLTFDSDITIVPEFHNRTENILSLNFEGKKFTLPKGMSRFPEVRGRKNLVLTFTGRSIRKQFS